MALKDNGMKFSKWSFRHVPCQDFKLALALCMICLFPQFIFFTLSLEQSYFYGFMTITITAFEFRNIKRQHFSH